MRNREFGRPVLDTGTIRTMDRYEIEVQLTELGAKIDEDHTDDQLRDDLIAALTARADQ